MPFDLTDLEASLPADFHPPALQLLRYWAGLCSGDRLPARAAIELPSVKFALGNIGLIEVSGDGSDFRYRLSGSELTRRDGYELTNKTVNEVRGDEYRDLIRNAFMEVVSTRRPKVGQRNSFLDGKKYRYDYVIMPLASDGQRIDMLLYGQWHLIP